MSIPGAVADIRISYEAVWPLLRTVTVAVPVAPPSTIKELEKQADKVVCLYTPDYFQAIGQFYTDFNQTSDEEVIALLRQIKQKPEGMVTK